MQTAWLQIVDCVLRPTRPALERCLGERERHLAARRPLAEERAKALAQCEQRIESARTAVFTADDGVVPGQMTLLEREWRELARRDADAGLMDLWARIAPPASIDRKVWRGIAPELQLAAAIALGADGENVAAAERAVEALRSALATHGTAVGARIQWAWFERDAPCVTALLTEPLRVAREACPADLQSAIFERALRLEHRVLEAALARFPERPCLAQDIAHAAFVDFVWRAAALSESANPVAALCTLWRAGYVLSEVSAASVTVEIPAL